MSAIQSSCTTHCKRKSDLKKSVTPWHITLQFFELLWDFQLGFYSWESLPNTFEALISCIQGHLYWCSTLILLSVYGYIECDLSNILYFGLRKNLLLHKLKQQEISFMFLSTPFLSLDFSIQWDQAQTWSPWKYSSPHCYGFIVIGRNAVVMQQTMSNGLQDGMSTFHGEFFWVP